MGPWRTSVLIVLLSLPMATGATAVATEVAHGNTPAGEVSMEQAVRMVMEGKVKTITGKTIDVKVQTVCIHGDSPGADKIVAAVRDGLVKAGAVVKPLRDWFKG